MKVTIEFTTDNDAFQSDTVEEMRAVTTRVKDHLIRYAELSYALESNTALFDSNGNRIGECRIESEE